MSNTLNIYSTSRRVLPQRRVVPAVTEEQLKILEELRENGSVVDAKVVGGGGWWCTCFSRGIGFEMCAVSTFIVSMFAVWIVILAVYLGQQVGSACQPTFWYVGEYTTYNYTAAKVCGIATFPVTTLSTLPAATSGSQQLYGLITGLFVTGILAFFLMGLKYAIYDMKHKDANVLWFANTSLYMWLFLERAVNWPIEAFILVMLLNTRIYEFGVLAAGGMLALASMLLITEIILHGAIYVRSTTSTLMLRPLQFALLIFGFILPLTFASFEFVTIGYPLNNGKAATTKAFIPYEVQVMYIVLIADISSSYIFNLISVAAAFAFLEDYNEDQELRKGYTKEKYDNSYDVEEKFQTDSGPTHSGWRFHTFFQMIQHMAHAGFTLSFAMVGWDFFFNGGYL